MNSLSPGVYYSPTLDNFLVVLPVSAPFTGRMIVDTEKGIFAITADKIGDTELIWVGSF